MPETCTSAHLPYRGPFHVCWGPAPAPSRDTLRKTGVSKREKWRREKEADIPWFTQKANKAPDMGLALFTEATCALWMERRCRASSQLGFRSPGKKKWTQRASVLKGICLRKREKEKENVMGRPSLGETGLQLYFQKGLLYPELHISRSERYKVMQNQLNIPSVLPLTKPGHFLHNFPQTRFLCCVH